ncbi:unnamed protein product [Amoebophrya sp. A25]|nr:unnamed protein product [Amoebophrya sp. A25]|eukprot:GSA25T00005646001.1
MRLLLTATMVYMYKNIRVPFLGFIITSSMSSGVDALTLKAAAGIIPTSRRAGRRRRQILQQGLTNRNQRPIERRVEEHESQRTDEQAVEYSQTSQSSDEAEEEDLALLLETESETPEDPARSPEVPASLVAEFFFPEGEDGGNADVHLGGDEASVARTEFDEDNAAHRTPEDEGRASGAVWNTRQEVDRNDQHGTVFPLSEIPSCVENLESPLVNSPRDERDKSEGSAAPLHVSIASPEDGAMSPPPGIFFLPRMNPTEDATREQWAAQETLLAMECTETGGTVDGGNHSSALLKTRNPSSRSSSRSPRRRSMGAADEHAEEHEDTAEEPDGEPPEAKRRRRAELPIAYPTPSPREVESPAHQEPERDATDRTRALPEEARAGYVVDKEFNDQTEQAERAHQQEEEDSDDLLIRLFGRPGANEGTTQAQTGRQTDPAQDEEEAYDDAQVDEEEWNEDDQDDDLNDKPIEVYQDFPLAPQKLNDLLQRIQRPRAGFFASLGKIHDAIIRDCDSLTKIELFEHPSEVQWGQMREPLNLWEPIGNRRKISARLSVFDAEDFLERLKDQVEILSVEIRYVPFVEDFYQNQHPGPVYLEDNPQPSGQRRTSPSFHNVEDWIRHQWAIADHEKREYMRYTGELVVPHFRFEQLREYQARARDTLTLIYHQKAQQSQEWSACIFSGRTCHG